MRSGTAIMIVALLAMLGAGGVFAWQGLSAPGDPMPAQFYVALALGAGFSILVGVGLMGLLFYSSRHGYDETPHSLHDRDS